ncbi:MAG: hypothetical protein IT381_12785 [Deltaproteobacteria bacterium]|nr:hypothetical protein [Deltaproteobacteria bacterium]
MIRALFLAVLFSSASALAADPNVYNPADVKPGQKAYGLTVFVGDKVERFELVLLGTLKNFLGPQKDLVVAKIEDPKLQLAGVVAGMSGSPIYVDGKILGALGYSMGAFMKEGICGITPIESMREVLDLPAIDPFGVPAQKPAGKPQAAVEGYAQQMIPMASPLSVSGVDPRLLDHFMPSFERAGYIAAPGGSAGGATKGVPRKLEAGGAIGAQLVRGDLSIASTGTITSVDGDKVLAFGHPFLGTGASSIPMANARVITIIASLQRSFKLSEIGEEVGCFTQDRLTAIAGETGKKAAVIPVSVEIATQPEGRKNRYSFEVARDPRLTPELIQLVLANAMMRRTDAGVAGTVELSGELELTNGDKYPLSALLAMERDPMLPLFAAMSVSRPFDLLWRNDYGSPLVKSVKVSVTLEREIRRMHVEWASLVRTTHKPGDTVGIEVGVKPDDQPEKTLSIELSLPDSTEPGDYEILIGGAGEANGNEFRNFGFLRPQNKESLVAAMKSIRPDGPLYAQLTGKGGSVRVGEALLSDVPLSYATQISPRDPDSRSQRSPGSLLQETKKSVGAMIYGEARLPLKVRPKR